MGTCIIKHKLLKHKCYGKVSATFQFDCFSYFNRKSQNQGQEYFCDWEEMEANVKICSETQNHGSTYLSSHITSLKFCKVCVCLVEFS